MILLPRQHSQLTDLSNLISALNNLLYCLKQQQLPSQLMPVKYLLDLYLII